MGNDFERDIKSQNERDYYDKLKDLILWMLLRTRVKKADINPLDLSGSTGVRNKQQFGEHEDISSNQIQFYV